MSQCLSNCDEKDLSISVEHFLCFLYILQQKNKFQENFIGGFQNLINLCGTNILFHILAQGCIFICSFKYYSSLSVATCILLCTILKVFQEIFQCKYRALHRKVERKQCSMNGTLFNREDMWAQSTILHIYLNYGNIFFKKTGSRLDVFHNPDNALTPRIATTIYCRRLQ